MECNYTVCKLKDASLSPHAVGQIEEGRFVLYIERKQDLAVYAMRERLALLFRRQYLCVFRFVGNYTHVCRISRIFRPWTCTWVIREYSLPVDRWGRLARSADGGMTWALLHDPARG